MGPDPKWSINALAAVLWSGGSPNAISPGCGQLPVLPTPRPCLLSHTRGQIPSSSMLPCSLRGISQLSEVPHAWSGFFLPRRVGMRVKRHLPKIFSLLINQTGVSSPKQRRAN